MRFSFFRTIFFTFFIGATAILPASGQADSVGVLEGTVIDAMTLQPVVGTVISMESLKEGQPKQQQKVGPTGAFSFSLIPGKGYYIQTEYYIRTEAAGYLPTKEKFIVTSGYTTLIRGKTIRLTRGVAVKAPVDSPVNKTTATPRPTAITSTATVTSGLSPAASPPKASTALKPAPATPAVTPALPVTAQSVQTQLRTVQFVQSKAELLPESQPALDQLLTFMRENPKISIELAGHTDNQGDFDANLVLSRQRVELVKAFLVQHGIAPNRISSRGYGSTRPVASNNSEATRQLNRRVEMTILTK